MKNFGLKTILFVLTIMGTGCNSAFQLLSTSGTTTPVAELTYLRGINIMDLGMSGTVLPGVLNTNYTKPTLAGLQALAARGHKVVRIPFLWERVQTTLNGALDATYLGYILGVLQDANTAGLKVILDMHNYGTYSVGGKAANIGSFAGPTNAQYADVWTKLSTAIQAVPAAAKAVYAYDIMNEPANFASTLGQVPDAGSFSIATFAATDESWVNNGNSTVAFDADLGGSLKVSAATLPDYGGYTILEVQKYMTVTAGNGPDFRIKGYMASLGDGSFPRIRFSTISSGFATRQYATVAIGGTGYFDVTFTLPPGDFADTARLYFEFLINTPAGTGPYVAYISEIIQGTGITGKAAAQVWEDASQAAVDAIRANNDKTLLMIEGHEYASTEHWATNHPTKWITDPADKIMYQGHYYMDNTGAGSYVNSFATETTNAISDGYASVSARAVADVKVFTDWVTAQGVKGYIGEFGWPNSAYAAGDYTSWNAAGEAVLAHLDSVKMGLTLWATGTWIDGTNGGGGNILNAYDGPASFAPLSSAAILEAHPSK